MDLSFKIYNKMRKRYGLAFCKGYSCGFIQRGHGRELQNIRMKVLCNMFSDNISDLESSVRTSKLPIEIRYMLISALVDIDRGLKQIPYVVSKGRATSVNDALRLVNELRYNINTYCENQPATVRQLDKEELLTTVDDIVELIMEEYVQPIVLQETRQKAKTK